MSLSRPDAVLMLRKYTAPDAPPMISVLLSTARIAKVRGRLIWEDTRLVVAPEEPSEEPILFPLEAVRFEYADAPRGADVERALIKERSEGVLTLISASGDRLYLFELKEK